MRILILNQPFWPDVVATAQHMADWAEYLASPEGGEHTVSVIASRSVYGKGGAVLPKRDTYKGVAIDRVGSNLFSKGRILTRLVDFGLFHLRALARALTLPRQDVVVCLTTPPMVGMVGRLLKLFRGSKYIQYEMDLYPDVAIALGVMKPAGLAARLFDGIHRYLLKKADRVIVLGRCMKSRLETKGVPPEKMVLITPWADPDEIRPVPRATNAFRKQYNLENKFLIMYSGNLGLGHDIETLCQAMKRLYKEGATGGGGNVDNSGGGIAFAFIGGGRRVDEVRKFVAERGEGMPEPLILPYQPREKLSETLSAADLHLITQGTGTSGIIVPSKYYGILAAGRPSLYIGPADTEIAMSITESHLGTVIPVGDVDGVVNAIRRWQHQSAALPTFESRARTVLRDHFSRQVCTRRLTEIAAQVAGT
jgi:glycosyltransferase involved in cell wall biosynthesis